MSELVDELRKVERLGGDTYSSAEVIGLVGRSADEIVRLQWAMRWGDDRAYREGRLVMDRKQELVDEIERLKAALTECAAGFSTKPGTVMSAAAEINSEFQRRMEIAGHALNDSAHT